MKTFSANSTKISAKILVFFVFFSLAIPSVSAASPFTDVPTNHKNYDAINYFYEMNAIDGVEFLPDKEMTLENFIKMALISLKYAPTDTEKKAKSQCSDVTSKDLIPYFNKALSVHIISKNVLSKKCNAEKKLSRVETLKLTFSIYGIPTPLIAETKTTYKDVNENVWFMPYIQKNAEINLLETDNKNYFRPYRKITRADAAELLYRAIQYIDENKKQSESQPAENTTTENSAKNNSVTAENNALLTEISNIPKIDIFLDVWKKLNKDYYFHEKEGISEEKLIYGALSGLTNKVKDPYTEFLEPSTATGTQESLSGKFEGIGTTLLEKNEKIIIISLIKNAPAEKAGVEVKDEIIKIDGESVENMSLEKTIDKIKGPAGSKVTLTLYRESTGKTLEFTITREIIEIPYISAHIVEKNIGLIELSLFGENTEKDFIEAMDSLEKEKIKGLIIDVRNNPGGYLTSVIGILKHFIAKGQPVTAIRYIDGSIYTEYSDGPGEYAKYPIIVIANEGSASAAEILAIGLQENSLATIVGTQTFGKGTVQELSSYEDGSLFKITIAEWLSPKKNSIQEKGVTPDIVVTISQEDRDAGKDPQLEKAIKEVQKKI
ncbi:PDZ domain-containing protein [Candidatus Peregrinibacteria bacterium]|nr:PDZ domain-containing protein [Candidatus Peregrinibacteria bacterium]